MNAKLTIGLGGFLTIDLEVHTADPKRNQTVPAEIKFGVGAITTRIDGIPRKVQAMKKGQAYYTVEEIAALCQQAQELYQ